MTEKVGVPPSAGRVQAERRRRRVVGKAQLATSAAGMLIVLALLACAQWLEASAVLMLTIGLLEILFQRALALFHGRPLAVAGVLRSDGVRPAAAAE
jgi:hypothetical protein